MCVCVCVCVSVCRDRQRETESEIFILSKEVMTALSNLLCWIKRPNKEAW